MLGIVLLILALVGIALTFFSGTFTSREDQRIGRGVGIGVFAAACVACILLGISPVGAGTVGVVDTFGSVAPETLKPGINYTSPFASVITFDAKTLEDREDMVSPSKEGLIVNLEASVLYHADPDKATTLYKTVGSNYQEVLLKPTFRSFVRDETAKHNVQALYTDGRALIEVGVRTRLMEAMAPRGIVVEQVLLRKVTLPEQLANAIVQKMQASEQASQMEFTLLKEKQEAERKTIEAKGIAEFQKIVSEGITPSLLQWKGIEATERLANSPNSKVVVIGGSGSNGLPLILSTANDK